jgi:hypothetical protein
MTFSSVVRDAIVLATVLGASPSLSPSAAQELSTDVGFVEAVSGRVVAMSHGTPVLVGVLDVINDQTRFDLLGNSELNLCHYRIGRFIVLKGPARIIVSKDGITVQAGSPVEISHQTCTVVQASKSQQGGIAARGPTSKK